MDFFFYGLFGGIVLDSYITDRYVYVITLSVVLLGAGVILLLWSLIYFSLSEKKENKLFRTWAHLASSYRLKKKISSRWGIEFPPPKGFLKPNERIFSHFECDEVPYSTKEVKLESVKGLVIFRNISLVLFGVAGFVIYFIFGTMQIFVVEYFCIKWDNEKESVFDKSQNA